MPDVTKPIQDKLVARLRQALPAGHAIMLMGSTAALAHGIRTVVRTKDVDVSLMLVGGDRDVASQEAVRAFLTALHVEPQRPPADGSWYKIFLEIEGEKWQVDVIRGKSRDRPDSQFIARDLLQEVVRAAVEIDPGVFVPLLTDLIVMKAWAAVDKERLVARNEERARNRTLADKYRADVRDYAEVALGQGALDPTRIEALLQAMKTDRAAQVRDVLGDEGALQGGFAGAQ